MLLLCYGNVGVWKVYFTIVAVFVHRTLVDDAVLVSVNAFQKHIFYFTFFNKEHRC